MSREQERIRRKLESNPVVECNKVRNRYCPDLFCDFERTQETRVILSISTMSCLGLCSIKG